jgi:predicted aconitase
MASLNLDERDEAALNGELGEASRLAIRILVRMAQLSGADRLRDVSSAHVDGWAGQAWTSWSGWSREEGGSRSRLP